MISVWKLRLRARTSGVVAIGVGGADFAEGEVGKHGKMLGQVIFEADAAGEVTLLGRVGRRLEIADIVGKAAEEINVPLGMGEKRKKRCC